MDVLTDLTPFLPVLGIFLIGGVFSLYICFYGVPNTPDIDAPLLELDSS